MPGFVARGRLHRLRGSPCTSRENAGNAALGCRNRLPPWHPFRCASRSGVCPRPVGNRVNPMKNPVWLTALVATVAAVLVATPFAASTQGTSSSTNNSSNAANRTVVAGTELEILSPAFAGTAGSQEATLLSAEMHTSNTIDLVLSVTLECALWTQVHTIGNGMSESTARVIVWVELDGEPVPVSSDDTTDTGEVVFCDRTHRQVVSDLDDEDAQFQQFLATRSANAFNWVAVDPGNTPNPHTIEVKARLEGDAQDLAFAQAGVGHRTLVIDPVQLGPGSSI